MIITMLLRLLLFVFSLIASIIGGLLPSLPVDIKNVLDVLFNGLASATGFIVLMFDLNVLNALLTFWLVVWALKHVIQFVVFIIFGRAKVE